MNVDATRPSSLPFGLPFGRSFELVPRWLMLVTVLVLGLPCHGQQTVAADSGSLSGSLMAAAALPTAFAAAAQGQPLVAVEEPAADSSSAGESPESAELPEAPQPQQAGDGSQTGSSKPLVAEAPKTVPTTTGKPVVGRYVKYIPAGSAAPQIHGREKFILGARDLYSVGNFGAMFVSAGWEQITNGSPNYGTDRGAFGERLGAAAIRETTEGIFTDGVFSVMLHEDPRYFVLGPQYGFVHRTLYAITRPLITRTSSNGHRTINAGLLLGYAASTALTNAYYPQSNRNLRDNLSGYGGSIGGAALGFAVDEFYDQMLEAVHLKKKP